MILGPRSLLAPSSESTALGELKLLRSQGQTRSSGISMTVEIIGYAMRRTDSRESTSPQELRQSSRSLVMEAMSL